MTGEAAVRLGVFLGLFAVLALAEGLLPKRRRSQPRWPRWGTNWAISILDSGMLGLMALALPALAVGAALDAGRLGWGLFNQLDWPAWVELLLALVLLDLAIWAQHLATHKVPVLWRIHRVHHADRDIDVSTAIRFHPLEIGLSMLWKVALVYALGPAALAVLLFEVMLNGVSLFNHANLALPGPLDRAIRAVIVTPDMHRVHHSVRREECDSNYGFTLALWDRLFGTYRAQPQDGHRDMVLGLEWQDDRPARLGWSILLPFRK